MSVKPPTIYPGVDTIRQIQELMLVCALLPAQSKLADLLRRALDTPSAPIRQRVEPMDDLHPHAVKAWFERNWPLETISAAEKALIAWQNNSDNMGQAIGDLRNVESVTGIKMVAVLHSEETGNQHTSGGTHE